MPSTDKPLNVTGLLNLFVVYIVWGSTYLAIRVAVRDGSGFTPFIMGASRAISGGVLLLAWSALRRKRIKPDRQELVTLLFSGLLLWLGGNGLVNWAEQRADSGLAALIIAATPIWVAIVTALVDRELPTLKMVAALLVGFAGMTVLSVPTLTSGVRSDFWSIVALLGAGLSWGAGSVLQSRKPVRLDVVVSAGYQQFFGGIGLLFMALLLKEPIPNPVREAWMAWGYLLVFGSLLAFTSFVRALQLLPTKIVMTYPYVNPVIAVFLGWLILDETVSVWTFGGAALVLLGVAGVFRERYRSTN
jgi:drug/metabolite transporter (DMT)-like permease